MFSTFNSPRVLLAVTIVLAHALVFIGLARMSPRLTAALLKAPIEVRFIEQAESPPAWQPPRVSLSVEAPVLTEPALAVFELPVAAPSTDRAITVPVRVPASPAMDENNILRRVSSVEYVREPAPRYPPQSKRLREQGLVVLRVIIDEQGRASRIEIESSSGHSRLDQAARQAVADAAFRPYMEDGAPRRALVLIPIEFALRPGAA